jgi:hypothetical protein
MARPIEQVEQELTKLRMASSQLGKELTIAYKSYFAAFAPTLKKQSIQGCYYLCTNGYPEAFLKLNYDRRAQLLKTLQRTINNAVANLVVQIDSPEKASNNNVDDDEPTGEITSMSMMPEDWFATPISLSTWQKHLEEEIGHSLKEISYKVNLLLQQGQVMPPTIPKPILEANPQADRQGGNIVNIPNILSVLIEQNSSEEELSTEQDDEDELPKILPIHSLYLRLTEVEFSDAAVLSCRKNIDVLVNKINGLRREYFQKQQDLKVAEAAAAWRNSWFEE